MVVERRTAGGSTLVGLVALVRPRQWVKNALVVAAPLAGGVLFQPDVLRATAVAFVAFCLAASAVYVANDILDAEADRAHPRKCQRPIAAGTVRPPTAIAWAAAFTVGAICLPLLLELAAPSNSGGIRLALIIGGYLILQLNYSVWLKHQPVLDIAAVAGGFLLRAIAGGTASGIPISNSFLTVVSFGALFVVVGKRFAELESHDHGEGTTRGVLQHYTPSYLRLLLAVSIAATLVAYTMWAFEIDNGRVGAAPFAAMSAIPFTLAILRYARDVDTAGGEAPEHAVFADPTLVALGLAWLLLFVGHVMQS